MSTDNALITQVEEQPCELQLIATSKEQMAIAQTKMVAWADRKLSEAKQQATEASEAKTIALAANFNTAPFHKNLTRATRMAEFYEKIKAALEAGYVIMPDLPVDVFAVRTMRDRPKPMESERAWNDRSQQSEAPRIGWGEYVDSQPVENTVTHYVQDKKTGDVNAVDYWRATEFDDVIDFPLSVAKPEIMSEVAAAMQHKVFDEIGVLPDRKEKKKDPVVVGIIKDPRSSKYSRKRVMFLLAWYLDTRTL